MAVKKRFGPGYVAASATNIYNPAANLVGYIYHIRLVNKDSAARTVTLYLGATGGSAGGTELLKDWSIAVAGEKDLYFPNGLKVTTTDFLTGIASAANAIVLTGMLEETAA